MAFFYINDEMMTLRLTITTLLQSTQNIFDNNSKTRMGNFDG